MDSSRSKISLSAKNVCRYPRCEDQRFAQNVFCLAHFEKMSWIVNRAWHRPAMWTGAAAFAIVVMVLVT
jgi:hypothetical protein